MKLNSPFAVLLTVAVTDLLTTQVDALTFEHVETDGPSMGLS